MWDEPDQDGNRTCLMQISVALPRLPRSMSGEGAGLAYGALLVEAVIKEMTLLGILGDNLPVVRLGAANGRIRTDRVWIEVEDALLALARRRWPLHWFAVRRHLNKEADRAAAIAAKLNDIYSGNSTGQSKAVHATCFALRGH